MPNTVWYEIRTLDGRRLSRTHGLGHDGKWRWVTNTVMGETGCDYEDIDIEEAETEDFITVDKKRYARVIEDFSDTAEHHEAMEDRDEIQRLTKEVVTLTVKLQFLRAKYEAEVEMLRHQVDTWRERYEASDQALESCIRQWNKQAAGANDNAE